MTYFASIETPMVTLVDPITSEPVVQVSLTLNTQGQHHRLSFLFLNDNPAEVQFVPGPEFKGPGIFFQLMGFGPERQDKGRPRFAMSLNMDDAGGLSTILDSTTTDPSGNIGQKDAPPLLINAGEGQGMYLAMYPGDNTVNFIDRTSGIETGRIPLSQVIEHLRRVPK